MNILFAIQGTGNGHISRAREIVPLLEKYGRVDLLVSGTQADVSLSQPLAFRKHGFSFIFGKNGGVDRWQTYKTMNLRQLWKDVHTLPVNAYDLVINDFEPVTAWACRLQKKESVALSHQCSFLSAKTPRPQKWNYSELIFRYYAPAAHHVGFHFERYDDFIHTPVIRSEIRRLEPTDKGHYTVYLPAYDDHAMISHLKNVRNVQWHVFSKHSKRSYTDANVQVFPVQNEQYNASMASSAGLLTGGGFESPAEAFFMGKKVMVVPMSGQYEQQCNALSAQHAGATLIRKIGPEFSSQLQNWVETGQAIPVSYPDETAALIDGLIQKYGPTAAQLR